MASLQVVEKLDSAEPPLVAVFTAGIPAAVAEEEDFVFQVYKRERPAAKNAPPVVETLIFGEGNETHFLGYDDKSTTLAKNDNNYAIGVFRPNYVGKSGPIIRIVPAAGLYVMKELNNKDAGGIDTVTINDLDYNTVRTQLTERFGSRKRRRELRSEQANAFDINANKAAALAAQLALESAAELSAAAPDSGIDGRLAKLPAFDDKTENPEQIYAFSALLPAEAWDSLDHRSILAPTEDADSLRASLPSFVLSRMGTAQAHVRNGDKDAGKLLARKLLHLTFLVRLIRAGKGVRGKSVEEFTIAPPAVVHVLRKTYFDDSGRMDQEARSKLMCHTAVLTLLCSDRCAVEAEGLERLGKDLQLAVSKLLPFFQEVGCKNASKSKAALLAPLQLPALGQPGGNAKRR